MNRYENEYKVKEMRRMSEKTSKKDLFERFNMTNHGDHPQLFEFDSKNKIVDVFVYRDPDCPYPYTITNTRNDSNIWTHQGFYLNEFMMILDVFLRKNNLPFEIIEK